ncbi:delta(1)-pyrroline-2-carboxylate reductase family protein [Acetobacter lambici]|uniref:Delta(1)-pyrroline-2-carboxylate reductase family protein n=1 Tax=Acetobacter lambici TaxID=1332824 RepID=A0ABT1F0M0_9PROT|nr:delta(1)-pyrroline-2-carboxylate reductase family protein [Acetobacter lambici]MCP1242491.1 delta(1)-pyrroline-2-carboxylate reductase family protein [Acetobacter lambici]MCP1258757.1 delta(1)-pyrroline-2-carboxylate reductase family protein [Acetobacter lambici]NHO57064.1 delta(1)-pyrroline-2-carboxylate reductase family protein [Acetobacter lambici]
MKHYSATQTAELLPFAALVDRLALTVQDYANGDIICPERAVVGAPKGTGLLMAMPCASADILVTKLLTICPDNAGTTRPTIQGQVTCADARTGDLLFSLDGPTVTMRRTAGISMLGIRLLARNPTKKVLLIGTGAQASAHCAAFASLHPQTTVMVRGRTSDRTKDFCERHKTLPLDLHPAHPDDKNFDVVITVTPSRHCLYDEQPTPDCLIIGVGAFRPDMIEVGPRVVHASRLYVDDPIGAPSEAGDLIQAGVDWSCVHSLASAMHTPPPTGQAIFFKSVGCAAWDLAACRVVAPD